MRGAKGRARTRPRDRRERIGRWLLRRNATSWRGVQQGEEIRGRRYVSRCVRRIGVFGRIHGRTNTHLILARRCFKRCCGGGERGAAEQARRDVTTRRATPLPLRKVMGQFGTCFWFGLERWRGVEVCCVAVRPKHDILIGKFKPNISSDGQQPFSHIFQPSRRRQIRTCLSDDERQFKNRNNL